MKIFTRLYQRLFYGKDYHLRPASEQWAIRTFVNAGMKPDLARTALKLVKLDHHPATFEFTCAVQDMAHEYAAEMQERLAW